MASLGKGLGDEVNDDGWYIGVITGYLLDFLFLAALMLCLALWLHRKDPKAIIRNIFPSSVRFNISVLVLDATLVSVALSFPFSFFVGRAEAYGLKLFLYASDEMVATVACGIGVVVVGDFVGYWRHRLEHVGWFWRSHVMHHSDRSMNWTTIYRFHPFNRLSTTVIDGVVVALVGFPWWAVTLNVFVRHFYGAFIHINRPWTLGFFRHLLVSPAMHRWHHVLEGDGVGKNFASVFSIFDRLFGTYYCPGPCDMKLGVPGVGDHELVRQYLLPFKLGDNPG